MYRNGKVFVLVTPNYSYDKINLIVWINIDQIMVLKSWINKLCMQAHIEDGGNSDIATVMNSWTDQNGYPLVTINTNNGEIYQKQFLFNHSSESRYLL